MSDCRRRQLDCVRPAAASQSETSAEVIDVFWCPLGEAYLFEM